MRLSILMPVYNEEATLRKAVGRVLAVTFQEGVEVEFVIVNDGSRDGTREILDSLDDPRIRVFHQPRNQGKGAAISRAVQEATGDYVIICDADEEYRPSEIPSLLQPVLDGEAELVYGSRTFGSHTSFSYWYVLGNKGVNLITNILFNAYISDVETCFKLMPLSLYRSLGITEKGFGMEAEVTGKLLARGYRPYEVAISYKARTREEGKKITVRDGFEALWILVRIRLREGSRSRPPKTLAS
ncbi:glycosyltransferase family 2 protein [Rathayibacter tritici]|uniref:Glycosyl transferase n=1 Tax=Rathayibacter tritici TaxID=33888 RepID=A0A160KTD7_9MICO|nr:glycosyltransferase family 2 protein [Rathayibacter tritici]AND17056.1 glycosyl transferase [Rathayibacter tritici]PPF31124.1 glycosyltransferase family 2 protein [Rathayibacter tritici]PPF70731.1 glycosyltransferase family 2 protein [Rathayibacter tritici]PPG08739.1 glycosyltransferase family 2 protein [Rathayibacter tritici]PPI14959.1 glycosyltransferase family 2 protein [Rathayibacter tritici]